MKKIISLLAILTAGIFILTGCGSSKDSKTSETTTEAEKNELVGSWSEDFFDSGFIFNEDGTGTDTFWNLTFTYKIKNGKVTTIYDSETYGSNEYTYSVSGDELTMTRTDSNESFTYKKQPDGSLDIAPVPGTVPAENEGETEEATN